MMLLILSWLVYALLFYLCACMVLYVWGHPRMFLKAKSNKLMVSSVTTPIGRHMAFSVQVANFMLHGIPGRSPAQTPSAKKEIYAAAIKRAFEKSAYFITTGSPHSRALYLRNYAWFYPTLLDPCTFISRHDADRRVMLIRRSLSIIFRSTRHVPYSTTLIPISPRKFVPINFIRDPSDSLLGVFSGIEQLTNAGLQDSNLYGDILERAASEGQALLEANREDLRFQLNHLIDSLREFGSENLKVPLIDRDENRSTATDTRLERRRFITNASVWTTFRKAVELGIVPQSEIEKRIGRTLETYKQELLALFGERGYIVDSLENLQAEDYRNVTLDFCHVHHGFWTFSSAREIELFQNTAELFLQNTELQDDSHRCFLVAANDPHIQFLKKIAVASYHGRTMWPAFNVEFADRLFDLSVATGNSRYRDAASEILRQLTIHIERIGYYPELLRPDGRPYRTWIYQCAHADTWFPRFIAVSAKEESANEPAKSLIRRQDNSPIWV
jgi:hypothetical protein